MRDAPGSPTDGDLPEPSSRIDFSLTRPILLLAVPLTLSRQLENVVGMADIFMVGRLGPEAISAVGISSAISIVVGASMIAVTTGTFAMVAQAIGAGAHREASAAAKQSLTLLFVLSVAISLLGIVGAPHFLAAMSVTPQIVAIGTPYLRVFFAGAALMTCNRALSTCLYGAGDTRTPLYISLLSNSVKIVASYLLIFGVWRVPRLGVTGAALGTVIGRVCAVAVGFWALYSGRFEFTFLPGTTYRPNLALARRILKIGIPSAVQGFLRNGARLIAVKLVALTASSTAAVAAYSIGRQIERVVHHPSLSFGTTATALVGQSLGAGDRQEAERRGWTTLLIGLITSVLLGLGVPLLARPVLTVFTDAPDVIDIGVIYLYAIALSVPFTSLSSTGGGGLRGAGDTMSGLNYTLISQWLVFLPAAYALTFLFGYDINGIWTALVVYAVLQAVLTVRKFARGEWKTRRI